MRDLDIKLKQQLTAMGADMVISVPGYLQARFDSYSHAKLIQKVLGNKAEVTSDPGDESKYFVSYQQ